MMLSTKLMMVLLVEYIIVAGVSAYDGSFSRALYWTGAAIITTAVLLMKG